MKTKTLLAVLIVILSVVGFSQITPPKDLIFNIEYTKPVESVQSIQLAFYIKVTPQAAERTLRDIMNLAIKYFPPTVEILGTAWDAVGRQKGDEKQIIFTNEKSSIVYNLKTKEFSYL